jgi:D-beta-D-heptose 7-phosphate kinase/D-beta-D-heptose 1-phosphate adenosyltransferase
MLNYLERIKNTRILVFGDIMLDRYWHGTVERVSPEAPVPVVRFQEEKLVLGGAANVAANVAGLGAYPVLAGVVGKDVEGASLRGLLEASKIGSECVFDSEVRPTTVKSRILAGGHQIARIDREELSDLDGKEAEGLLNGIGELTRGCDAVILSDYGKGMVTRQMTSELIGTAREFGVPVMADPKGIDYKKYDVAAILTPNKKEALELFRAENKRNGDVMEAGRYILDRFHLEEVLITLGAEGMALFSKTAEPVIIPASKRNVFDVTGAGDTVIAALAVARAVGIGSIQGARIANAAAGEVIEKVGTTAIGLEDLENASSLFMEKESESG